MPAEAFGGYGKPPYVPIFVLHWRGFVLFVDSERRAGSHACPREVFAAPAAS